MLLTGLFIGAAAVTGGIGIGKSAVAGYDQSKAKKLNTNSEDRLESTGQRLNETRRQCSDALSALGQEKVFVLNGSVRRFLDLFTQLKNVDFTNSVGLDELDKLHVDRKEFDELAAMSSFAASLAEGALAGVTGGALAAFGAYSAASALACASTGTAIASLSGVAATNATLAFFGGGSLAVGGMGVAGGSAVLGGLVAGPALLVLGLIVGAKAGKNLENAKANAAEASRICAEYEAGIEQCVAIRRRSYLFYGLLARLESYMTPLLFAMEKIIAEEGTDYSKFSAESKKAIAAAASMAVTIKSVLDTPILSEDGSLTDESGKVNFDADNGKGVSRNGQAEEAGEGKNTAVQEADVKEPAEPQGTAAHVVVQLEESKMRLLLPDGYQKLKPNKNHKEVEAQFGPNLCTYVFGTDNASIFASFFHTTPDKAMDFSDVKGLIDGIHGCLSDEQGLIEAKAGKTKRGYDFIYSIVKTVSAEGLGVSYFLRMNLGYQSEIVEVQAGFSETGVTGTRESVCVGLAEKLGLITVSDHLEGWNEDPYDPSFKKGQLMNLAEREGLDGLFADHPLSQAREFILAVIKDELVLARNLDDLEEKKASVPEEKPQGDSGHELLCKAFEKDGGCRRYTVAVDVEAIG